MWNIFHDSSLEFFWHNLIFKFLIYTNLNTLAQLNKLPCQPTYCTFKNDFFYSHKFLQHPRTIQIIICTKCSLRRRKMYSEKVFQSIAIPLTFYFLTPRHFFVAFSFCLYFLLTCESYICFLLISENTSRQPSSPSFTLALVACTRTLFPV